MSLLASPHYGERWGRYWLDVAGYADSEGGVSADPVREVAWKYRDYVIRAFNSDKPYDRFLLEQLAGDELVDYEHAPVVTEEMVENLIATGFLRMGIDETGSRTMNFVPERLGVISDAIKVVGSGVMGLTMECCRCHSHKYDPIPHRDYYRFKAIFQGRLRRARLADLQEPLAGHRHARAAKTRSPRKIPRSKARLKKLESQRKKAIAEVAVGTAQAALSGSNVKPTARKLCGRSRSRTTTARCRNGFSWKNCKRREFSRTASSRLRCKRLGKALRTSNRTFSKSGGRWNRRWRFARSGTGANRRRLISSGAASTISPGPLVGPGVPSVLTDGQTPFVAEPPFPGKTGRRLAFARWLTQPDHPLTARVMVNRIWYHHFGAGLVAIAGKLRRQRRSAFASRTSWIGWRSNSSSGAGASRRCTG